MSLQWRGSVQGIVAVTASITTVTSPKSTEEISCEFIFEKIIIYGRTS